MERLASLDFRSVKVKTCSSQAHLVRAKAIIATALGSRGMQGRYARAVRERIQTDGNPENRQKQRNNRNGVKKLEKTQLLILDDLFLVPLTPRNAHTLYGNHRRPPWSQINHHHITAPELTGTKQSVTPQWQMQYWNFRFECGDPAKKWLRSPHFIIGTRLKSVKVWGCEAMMWG